MNGALTLPLKDPTENPNAGYGALGVNAAGQPIFVKADGTIQKLVPSTVAGKYRIKDDGTFQLWNGTQNKWHSLAISGAAGAEVLTIAAGEV